jgi:hypothetical protein
MSISEGTKLASSGKVRCRGGKGGGKRDIHRIRTMSRPEGPEVCSRGKDCRKGREEEMFR